MNSTSTTAQRPGEGHEDGFFRDDAGTLETTLIPLAAIIADPENQPRKETGRAQVSAMVRALTGEQPAGLEPVLVAQAGESFELFDGFHRYTAAVEAGGTEIPARVARTREEALALAPTLNNHGTRWTKQDAMRHIVRCIREGVFMDGGHRVRPIEAVAQDYAHFGVNRHSVTRYLDKVAAGDPAVAAYLAQARRQSTRGGRRVRRLSPEELHEKRADKRRAQAMNHLEQAAMLLIGEDTGQRGAMIKHFAECLEKAAAGKLQRQQEPAF